MAPVSKSLYAVVKKTEKAEIDQKGTLRKLPGFWYVKLYESISTAWEHVVVDKESCVLLEIMFTALGCKKFEGVMLHRMASGEQSGKVWHFNDDLEIKLRDEQNRILISSRWVEDSSEQDMTAEGLVLYAVLPKCKIIEIIMKGELEGDMPWQKYRHIGLRNSKEKAWEREVYVNGACPSKWKNYMVLRITITHKGVLKFMTTTNGPDGKFKTMLQRESYDDRDYGVWRWNLPNLPLKMKNSENEDVIKTTWETLEDLSSEAVKDRPCENDNLHQSKKQRCSSQGWTKFF